MPLSTGNSFLMLRSLFCIAANLTTNELIGRRRYGYMKVWLCEGHLPYALAGDWCTAQPLFASRCFPCYRRGTGDATIALTAARSATARSSGNRAGRPGGLSMRTTSGCVTETSCSDSVNCLNYRHVVRMAQEQQRVRHGVVRRLMEH